MAKIKAGLNNTLGDFLNLTIRGLTCIILGMVYAWKFSIVLAALIPFMVFFTIKMIMTLKKYSIGEMNSYGSASNIAQEALSSIRTVCAYGLEKRVIKSYAIKLNACEEMAKKKGLFGGIFGILQNSTFNFFIAIAISYGLYLFRTNSRTYSPATIMPSFFCLITAAQAFSQAFPFIKVLIEAKMAAKKVYEIIIDDGRSESGVKIRREGKVNGEIEFEKVTFSKAQNSDSKIMKNFNFKIPAGKTVTFIETK